MALKHQWHSRARIELDETLAYVFREFGEKFYILAFWNNRNDDTNATELLSER